MTAEDPAGVSPIPTQNSPRGLIQGQRGFNIALAWAHPLGNVGEKNSFSYQSSGPFADSNAAAK